MRELDANHVMSSERGFTIVEVVAAVAVMLIGLLSLVGLFDDSRDQNASGERTEIAVMQAEQAIEEMRGIPYSHLMLNAGATDPTAGERVLNSGANFKVKTDLTEPLVYYSTEGKPLSDAWVEPMSQVTIGGDDGLELTIHRYITWRDEECRAVDLGSLGLNLPGSIDENQIPLTDLVNNALNNLLGLLSGSQKTLVQNLRNRLNNFKNALAGQESSLAAAAGGITQLDLCDINLTLLGELQQLGRLNPGLAATGGLTDDLEALQSSLSGICLPIVGCVLGQAQNTAIAGVTSQLDCLFGASADTQPEFDSYLAGLATGLSNVANDVSNTAKNSKRVTVAVKVEPRPGIAPIKPIWISSVVRDPSAALLSSGGAACQ